MNKLDFMRMGKKSVQTYLNSKYDINVDLRYIMPKSYTDVYGKQRGRYTIDLAAYPQVRNENMLRSEFLVSYDPFDHSYLVEELCRYASKKLQPAYILATSDAIRDNLKKN